MKQALGRTVARLPPPEPRLMAVAASEWSDPSGASPSPRWGERAQVGVVTQSFPPFERLLGVNGLGNAVLKHCCSSDVLASPSKLWEIVPIIHDVMFDLMGVTPGATRWVMRTGRNVLYRARQHRRR